MKRIELVREFSTTPERLWELIVDPEHYKYWTKAFSEGSKFIGDWSLGSKIRFVMENEQGNESGMLSEIAASQWPNHISIRHIGLVMNGIEDYESEETKRWTPAYENYTFEPTNDGHCEFRMAQDIPEEYEVEFLANWDKAFDLIADRLLQLHELHSFITLEVFSKKSPSELWNRLTVPDEVRLWNFANDDWHCPKASNVLNVGEEFHYEMAAKDGSMSFDFWGTFTEIAVNQRLAYTLGDGRQVAIDLIEKPRGTLIIERFQPEAENSLHLQRQGWLSILQNFGR